MLRDIEIQRSNPLLGIIAMMNGNDHKCTRVERGIYEIGHFNGDAHIPKEVLKDKYPTVECVLRELDRHEGAPEDCGLLLDGDESERSKHEAPRERGRRR